MIRMKLYFVWVCVVYMEVEVRWNFLKVFYDFLLKIYNFVILKVVIFDGNVDCIRWKYCVVFIRRLVNIYGRVNWGKLFI